MRLVILTPGAGGMYCGNCFRDNALAQALIRQGHSVILLPLYLPMTLDESTATAPGIPTFFGGINVYLSQKFGFYRSAPAWLRRLVDHPRLLKMVSGRAANTDARLLGEMNVSMLLGEEGNQVRELDDLLGWLRQQPKPDAILLSNALLVGFVRRLKQELKTRIIVCLQGEEAFLDSMLEPWRTQSWDTVAERGSEVDGWMAASRHFANRMGERLGIPSARLHVVPNGIQLDGYRQLPPREAKKPGAPMTVGFFSRMCPEKGMDIVIDAFLALRKTGRWNHVQLAIGGGCGAGEKAYVDEQRLRVEKAGLSDAVHFHPNVSREEKIAFYARCDITCVPARQSEAFGICLIESLAAGTPVIQPEWVTYPELIQSTGGGILYSPHTAAGLAEALDSALSNPARLRQLGETGRTSVFEHYTDDVMAQNVVRAVSRIVPTFNETASESSRTANRPSVT
jgi:glycosyltransferase involved in cell wall biosynthesis